MVKGIEHIAIYANDTFELSKWYVDNLDGRIVYDNGKGVYFVAFGDNSMIELCRNTDEENSLTELNTPGLRHIALCVEDFEQEVEKIKALGVKIIKDVEVSSSGVSTIFFADPEGNILHFISRPAPLV